MADLINILRLFRLTVLRPNGSPVVGATVRLLNSAGTDVTAGFFLNILPTSDSGGFIIRPFTTFTGLPAGIYTIQVMATGFATWSHVTDALFIGAADLTVNLAYPTQLGDYRISEPKKPASSMIAIVSPVLSPNAFEWEYIRCKVEAPDNTFSVLEAPVEKLTGMAEVDYHNRIQLGTRPFLVADGELSRPDTDFSTVAHITFSSLSPEGETPITYTRPELEGEDDIQTEYWIPVAHTLPPDGQSDLSSYVTSTNREWMVPAQPVTVFRGYYRDVMVWLPVDLDYLLTVNYYDGSGGLVNTTTDALTSSPYVQRIRVNTDVDEAITRAELSITAAQTAITKVLNVNYRD